MTHVYRLVVLAIVVSLFSGMWPTNVKADPEADTLEWRVQGSVRDGAVALTVYATSNPSHTMITHGNLPQPIRTVVDGMFTTHATFSSTQGEIPTQLASQVPSLGLVMTLSWNPQVCSDFVTGLTLRGNFTHAGWLVSSQMLQITADHGRTRKVADQRYGSDKWYTTGIFGQSRGVVTVYQSPFLTEPECASFSWYRTATQQPITTGAVTLRGLTPTLSIQGRNLVQDDIPFERYTLFWTDEQGQHEQPVLSGVNPAVRYWGCVGAWCPNEIRLDNPSIPQGRGKLRIVVGDQVATIPITRY